MGGALLGLASEQQVCLRYPHGDGVPTSDPILPIWEHFGTRYPYLSTTCCADTPTCAHQAKSCNAACATTVPVAVLSVLTDVPILLVPNPAFSFHHSQPSSSVVTAPRRHVNS